MATYQVDTDGGTYEVDTEEPSYMEDVAKNAGKEIAALPGQVPTMAQQGLGLASAPMDALKAIPQMIGGTDPSETDFAQDLQPIIEGNKSTLNTIQNPVESFRNAPINTAGTALGLIGGVRGMMPEKAPIPASIPESPAIPEAPQVPPKVVPMAEGPQPKFKGASQVPPEPMKQAPPPPAQEAAAPPVQSNPLFDKAKEAGDYARRGYEKFAGKPGMTASIADWVQAKSQKLAALEMGMQPRQAKNLGHTAQAAENAVRAIGQYGIDSGIVSPTGTFKADLARNTELLNGAGSKIGAIREMADKMHDPLTTPIDTLQEIQARLGPTYEQGMPGSSEYQTALKIVGKSDPTFSGAAETATKLNKLANTNNRINQPHQPFTEVANIISEINNERIKKTVGPQNAEAYEQALREFGINKKINEFLKNKVAPKRLGPGSLTSNLVQKGLDEFGYKAGSHVANKMSTNILKNPSIAKSLPSLFKEFINQVEDLSGEVTGMSEGGLVTEDMGEFVRNR